MDSVSLTIDGRSITAEKGKTVLQAALEHGFQIPYYCYHPALGVDGSCRVCIVKIDKMPKLQTACSTPVAEGMVVYTTTPDVVEARAGVFEFLLVNHPLDCPVCDKGGECPLQDFSYTFGPDQSRMSFPRRTFDGDGVKADVDFGPTLMLNRNRCILCTRCVRFMKEVDGDAQIGIVDRGNGSEIATFQEEGVHSLLSGNLMDVCPVGAITTRDYRFKSRPWDNPEAVDTICTLCSKGCNTTAWLKAKPEWAKGARLIRFTPRFNPEVNGYWMCDIGRFEYHWIESDDRLRQPLLRDGDESHRAVPWGEAMAVLRGRLADVEAAGQPLQFLTSAHASLEELFLLGRLAESLGGAPLAVSWRHREKQQPAPSKFMVPPTDAPNVTGARDLGLAVGPGMAGAPDLEWLRQAVEQGRVGALYVFDSGPEGSLGDVNWLVEARAAGKLPLLVVHGVLMTRLTRLADIVLPGATFVEKNASYTNDQGRVQGATAVLPPPGEALEDWRIFVTLAGVLGIACSYSSASEIRRDIAARLSEHASYRDLEQLAVSPAVSGRHWLQTSNPSERWKWDFLFQDLPPVKFKNPEAISPVGIIRLDPAATEK